VENPNPYKAPEVSVAGGSQLRQIVGAVLRTTAIVAGMLAIVCGAAGTRWLLLEAQRGVRSTQSLFGI